MNSLPKTVTQQRRGYDLNPGPSESSTLTVRLPSHSVQHYPHQIEVMELSITVDIRVINIHDTSTVVGVATVDEFVDNTIDLP